MNIFVVYYTDGSNYQEVVGGYVTKEDAIKRIKRATIPGSMFIRERRLNEDWQKD